MRVTTKRMAISHPFFRGDPIGRKAKRGDAIGAEAQQSLFRSLRVRSVATKLCRVRRSRNSAEGFHLWKTADGHNLRETADTRAHHEADGNKPSAFFCAPYAGLEGEASR